MLPTLYLFSFLSILYQGLPRPPMASKFPSKMYLLSISLLSQSRWTLTLHVGILGWAQAPTWKPGPHGPLQDPGSLGLPHLTKDHLPSSSLLTPKLFCVRSLSLRFYYLLKCSVVLPLILCLLNVSSFLSEKYNTKLGFPFYHTSFLPPSDEIK